MQIQGHDDNEDTRSDKQLAARRGWEARGCSGTASVHRGHRLRVHRRTLRVFCLPCIRVIRVLTLLILHLLTRLMVRMVRMTMLDLSAREEREVAKKPWKCDPTEEVPVRQI